MDEKRRKRTRDKNSSSFVREWGAFIAMAVIAAAFSLWSERHWATAWLSYLPPLVWSLPVLLSWAWPLIFRKRIKWPNVAAQLFFFVLILGFRIPLLTLFSPPTPNLQVGSLNVARGSARPEAIAAWAAADNLDVICFQETNTRKPDYWDRMKAAMPGWHFAIRREVGVISRAPFASTSALPAPGGLEREIQVVRLQSDPPVTIVNNHWPALPMRIQRSGVEDFKYWMDQREACCRQLESVVRKVEGPTIIAGDFNTPLNAGLFDRLQALGRHAHRSVGWGFAWSYPASFPVTAIDHIVVRRGDPVHFKVGPDVGSDHRPVSASVFVARRP